MNRHERRAAEAQARRGGDTSWSREEGTAYREKLAADHAREVVLAWVARVDADDTDPADVWGLIVDSSDLAADHFRSQDGATAAEHTGVLVGTILAADAARWFCKVNESMQPGEEEKILERTREITEEGRLPTLIVGGGGSMLWSCRLPDDDDDGEPDDVDAEDGEVLA